MMNNIDEIRNFFKNDKFATEVSGISIEEVKDGYAKCSMKLEDKHYNAAGGVMGGAIYTLADFTFAVATNAFGIMTVTSVGQINFLNPVKGDYLYAEAKMLKDGSKICFYEISVYDDSETMIAKVSMDGVHVGKYE